MAYCPSRTFLILWLEINWSVTYLPSKPAQKIEQKKKTAPHSIKHNTEQKKGNGLIVTDCLIKLTKKQILKNRTFASIYFFTYNTWWDINNKCPTINPDLFLFYFSLWSLCAYYFFVFLPLVGARAYTRSRRSGDVDLEGEMRHNPRQKNNKK